MRTNKENGCVKEWRKNCKKIITDKRKPVNFGEECKLLLPDNLFGSKLLMPSPSSPGGL
jgi:hypothetical protein